MLVAITVFATLIAIIIALILFYTGRTYRFWSDRGFLCLEPHPVLGNFRHVRTVHFSELFDTIYSEFRGRTKVAGAYLFTRPVAVVLDLDVVKAILIKDFNNFTNRTHTGLLNEEEDPLNAHLFNLPGEQWRPLRTTLSPTFTSGKMKFMFPTVVNVAQGLETAIDSAIAEATQPGVIELHDIMGRYTTDVILTCAFGVQCNNLKDAHNPIREFGQKVFNEKCFTPRARLLKFTYLNILKHVGYKRFTQQDTQFFVDIAKEAIQSRQNKEFQRNDFLQLLVEVMDRSIKATGRPAFTLPQMAAQMFIFFVAGYETSSSNMSYTLYELAKNQVVQDKLRASIFDVLKKYPDRAICFEAITDMTYMNQVMDETMRLYPALSHLSRYPKEDYPVPGTDLIIPRNVKVCIPMKSIHYDPEYYENPYEFRPERFDIDKIGNRHPQAFLAFGDGPRHCIGLRFARMQVKIGMAMLLTQFRFSVAQRTPMVMPISTESTVLLPANGVWLKVERI